MVASNDYVRRILHCLEQAAAANLETPCRQGRTIEIRPDMADEVMITGDIHGNRRNFDRIREAAALDEHPGRHLVLQEVCHGGQTYPHSGGCMSHMILEEVAEMKTRYPDRLHFILGNHELAELTDYPIQKNRQMLNLQFWLGLQETYGPAVEIIHDAYRQFLLTCPLAVRLPWGVFISHSIPEDVAYGMFDPSVFTRELADADYFEGGDVFQLLWGRDYRAANALAFAKMVEADVLINGHEPCPGGFCTPNDSQVIIDCCGPKAAYVILPTGEKLDHEEIVRRIKLL